MSQRRILRLSGADTRSFLQGLVTNDVAKIDQGLVYAALLTPQGKFLADFFLVAAGEDVLLDVASDFADDLVKRLSMYRLRAKVEITDSAVQMRQGTGPAPDGALMDPRHGDMGWRLYGPDTGPDARDDGSDWDAIRVAHCIPQTGVELTADSYILEVGFEALNGVDFRKGCYVGQEVTARMKHKTTLRKGLCRVAIEGTAPTGSAILTADNKIAGTLFTQSGPHAIAYLRFDRANGEMHADGATIRWTKPE